MINKETIISVFDDRMTLLQYLKSVQKALQDSVLTSVEMVNTDETHAKLILHFEDGSTKETEAIELPTGFKVIQDNSVEDWTAYINAHVGDLVIADDGFIGLITKLERQTFEQQGERISRIEITGLESNMLPTKYIGTYNGVTDTWTHEELQISGGTKLYKHTITTNLSVPNTIVIVINNSTELIDTISEINTEVNASLKSYVLYTGQLIIKASYQGNKTNLYTLNETGTIDTLSVTSASDVVSEL